MRHLREFIATGFYSGLFPVAPGTMGTWVALCLLVFLAVTTQVSLLILGIAGGVIFSLLTLITGGGYAEEIGQEDPGSVVMDEFAGMAVALAFAQLTVPSIAAAFVLFRIFDIIKPWPANKLQDLPGAPGILLDDLVAGVYAGIVMLVLRHFLPII